MKAVVLLLVVIYTHSTLVQGIVIDGPSNVTYLPGLTPLPIELTCNVTGTASWRVNNMTYTIGQLANGRLPGHSRTGTNILVNSPINNTEYICVSVTNENDTESDPAYIIIAGVPDMVPDVTVDNIINIIGNNVTLTLSWGEPFNNFDPIVNYIVSCSGDVTCSPNFTTTDNTTRNYPITNLTPITTYTFSVVATNSIGSGEAGVVTIITPDVPDMVPGVTVDNNTIYINGNNVTLTVSWGEPFSNLDPIVNYAVSCSGDDACPPNFTTTDNTTRSYTITNLSPNTNYTFSVVATNSFGSGEAGVVMITTPVIGQVTGVTVTCEAVNTRNQCTVTWNLVTQGDITGYQVYYNGTMINVTSSTTTRTVTAPSLPVGVFMGTIVVMVTATSRYGIGPASEPKAAVIYASSVIDIGSYRFSVPNNISDPYNVAVTCNIHPDSTADLCVVIAVSNVTMAKSGNASITNDMARVTVNGLQCNVTYTIIAGGTFNGSLVGPISVHVDIIESCLPSPPTGNGNGDCEEDCGTGIGVGIAAVVIGGIIVIAVIVYIRYKKKHKVTDQEKGDDKISKDKDTLRQPLQDVKADSPEAKNMTQQVQVQAVYEQVTKEKPPKAMQKEQLNYADLELQRGPQRFGDDDDGHTVQYGEVTETKQ